jgi:hypothetical protein
MDTKRRNLVLGAATAAGFALATSGCGSRPEYIRTAARIRAKPASALTAGAGGDAIARELVRCATLAPSSHNTQCWKFHVGEGSIDIAPDWSRRCPAVDPDDHHLFVTLGCATENLLQAAPVFGLRGDAQFESGAGSALRIALQPGPVNESPLYQAIFRRQSTRGLYDGHALPNAELALLEAAGRSPGCEVVLLTDAAALERVLAHVLRGNSAQMDDPAFVAELKHWIRFSDAAALASGDGLFTRASGNPEMPTWVGEHMFDFFFTKRGENDKYAKQLRSSAGVAIFSAAVDEPRGWIEAGRCFERFALQATALGIRCAMLNQPVEVAAQRPQFARDFGFARRRVDLVVRFGRGEALPASLRRPLEAVLA